MEVETTSEALLGGGGEDAELTVVQAAVDGTDVERGAEVTDGVEVAAMEDDVSAEGAPARGATTTPAVRVRRPIPAWPLVYYRVQPDNTAEGDVLWYRTNTAPLAVFFFFFEHLLQKTFMLPIIYLFIHFI
jgi:hypothetical protein